MRYKTQPFEHQRREVEEHGNDTARALWWEQGTGKTKAILDNAALLYEQGEIDALLVMAPSGVHRNWVAEEIEHHLSVPFDAFAYQTQRASTKWHKRELEYLLKSQKLAILAIGYDGTRTKAGHQYVERFLKRRTVMAVADESHHIKSPDAKRTRRACALGAKAAYRRALSGTPIANVGLDVYAQIKFLDPNYWRRHELHPYSVFKTHFAQWTNRNGFEQFVAHVNLDELKSHVERVGSRICKADVLDLPPKLYSKRYVELTAPQRRAYEELKNLCLAQLEGEGEATAEHPLVKLLRLQQITCGYVPSDEGELHKFDDSNPRIEALQEVTSELTHKAIIWARFTEDIDQIMAALGRDAVRYDGHVGNDDRAKAIEAFQRGDAKFFVAKPQTAGTGLTLHAARTVIYYNNSFSLTDRLQSEDRAHRIGQEHPVNYIDIIAEHTIDEYLVASLKKKQDIASYLTGDELKNWL